MLLPHLARLGAVHLAHVATTRSLSAVNAQRRFGFTTASTSADAVLDDESLDAIFIVTRHHTHAELVCRALETGKAVFVEKPLALTRDELQRVIDVVAKTGNDRLMVGFNRRFAPLLVQLRSRFGQPGGSSVTRYLVNAGRLDADSWYRNEELEGSRFIGEGGHFIDTLSWWADSLPEEVYAVPGPERGRPAGHRAVPERLERHHHVRHRRQPPLPEGDARRRGRWPERTARQLRRQPWSGPDGAAAPHGRAAARTRASGPSSRTSSRPAGRVLRCPSPSSPWSPPPGRRSRWARACRAAARSGCERDPHRDGSAGTRAGLPGCRPPRWPGAPATRRCRWPGRAGR